MHVCSVIKKVEIVRGSISDYEQLSYLHYRDRTLGPFAAIFAIRPRRTMHTCKTVGVIVYKMPSIALELRNVALGGMFGGLDRDTRLAVINKNIRCISRVIIEPRFRSIGLASWLVKETMPRMDVPVIEAMAVMGRVNPFFEKAGMVAYRGDEPARNSCLTEAFSLVGIEKDELIDAQKVHGRIEGLGAVESEFIEREIKNFLKSYGKRRNMSHSLERTRYVLGKLTYRPIYYLWMNP